MKLNLYLISLSMLVIFLISCDQGERNEISASNNTNVYEEAFVAAFGDYSKVNTWNTSGQFSLEITPAPDGIVKIYAPWNDEFLLVAHYSHARSTFTSRFDAPATSGKFVVALGEDLYYAWPDGQVTPQSPRADDAKVSDKAFQWILAVENDFDAESKARRGAGGKGKIDFDFNDLLIGISSVVTDDGVSVDFTPLACGDNQPFYIHLKTYESDQLLWQANYEISDDCEFHQWFGIKDFTKAINTGINSPGQSINSSIMSLEAITVAMSGCHITLPSYWTLSNYSHLDHDYKGNIIDVWGIYITVGTYKGVDYIKKNAEYGLICSEGAGSAPHMLLFPDTGQSGLWRWPCEGNSIGDCYPVFADWASDYGEQYMAWHEWMYSPVTTRIRY